MQIIHSFMVLIFRLCCIINEYYNDEIMIKYILRKRGKSVLLLAGVFAVLALVSIVSGGNVFNTVFANDTSYYVDNLAGNDANDGLTPETAWQSLDRINATVFEPGDRIRLNAGGTWAGQFAPQGSGMDGAPIVIDMYGTGDKPRIDGNGVFATVSLTNQQYWEINNLEITNDASANDAGILISIM
jgi:hypothetical protein